MGGVGSACKWVRLEALVMWGAGAGAVGGAEECMQGGTGQPGLHNPAASCAGAGQPSE